MAQHTVGVPELGESAEAVVVVEWIVSVGEDVAAGDPLLIVETNKIDTEVPAPFAGVVVELLAAVGAELAVGDPLCIIEP